jgi:hypothetical protein
MEHGGSVRGWVVKREDEGGAGSVPEESIAWGAFEPHIRLLIGEAPI